MEIKRILDFEMDEGIFDLSAAQKKRISKAKLEIKQKKILTEGSANKERNGSTKNLNLQN